MIPHTTLGLVQHTRLTYTLPTQQRMRQSYKLHRPSPPTFHLVITLRHHKQCTPRTINKRSMLHPLAELDNRLEEVYRWSILDLWLMNLFDGYLNINEGARPGSIYRVQSRLHLPIIRAVYLQELYVFL